VTHIICRAMTCLFWEEGVCGSEEIEYEPDVGCLTFQDLGDLELEADDEDEEFEWGEDSSDDEYDDDDEDWDDGDDEWEEDDIDL
jgi:hypothetical protein